MVDELTKSLQMRLHTSRRVPMPLLPCLPTDARENGLIMGGYAMYQPAVAARVREAAYAVNAEKLLAVLCDPSKTVGELLEGLSCVAHLLLTLFRALGTAIMTGQLYNDLRATIRGIVHVVLKVQEHCPATPVLF